MQSTMTRRRPLGHGVLAALGASLALLGVAPQAQARVHVSVGIGVPVYPWGPVWWGTPWYPYAWPYSPMLVAPPAVIAAPPPVVTVQTPPPLGPAPPAYWYYCSNPAGYYPQVPACPAGWTPVLAQPQPQEPEPEPR